MKEMQEALRGFRHCLSQEEIDCVGCPYLFDHDCKYELCSDVERWLTFFVEGAINGREAEK